MLDAKEVAALIGTKANAPEYAFEFVTTVFPVDLVKADATRVCVERSSTMSRVRYCEL